MKCFTRFCPVNQHTCVYKNSSLLLCNNHIVQELCESRGGRPGLSVLTSLLVSVIEPCFGIGHSLSLICQLTSEDIKHHFIIILCNSLGCFYKNVTTHARLSHTAEPLTFCFERWKHLSVRSLRTLSEELNRYIPYDKNGSF